MLIPGSEADTAEIIVEALFWLSLIALSPFLGRAVYQLMLPVWANIFPLKSVKLFYSHDGKEYCASVDPKSDLLEAALALMIVAEKKGAESKEVSTSDATSKIVIENNDGRVDVRKK